MKNRIIACIFVLCAGWLVSASAQSPTPQAQPLKIPYVVRVDHPVAPSGAVIRLGLNGDFDQKFLASLRLSIEHVTAKFYVIDNSTVAAEVPFNLNLRFPTSVPNTPAPVEMIFYSDEHGGDAFRQFSLLLSPSVVDKKVEISRVTPFPQSRSVDVVFSDKVPMESWGSVKIYFDDRSVDKITRMDEKVFTVEPPENLPVATSHTVYVKVGAMDGPSRVVSFSTPSPTPQVLAGSFSRPPYEVLLIGGVIALGIALVYYFYLRKTRRPVVESEKPNEGEKPNESEKPKEGSAETLHLPEEIPSDLIDACVAGECVLYAGAGLAAQAGLPTWGGFVFRLITWAHDSGFISKAEAASYTEEVANGQADPVADSIVSRFTTEDQQSDLNDYLRKIFLGRRTPSALHSQLKRIKFSAILTTNFDNLLEEVYETTEDQVFTPRDSEALLAALTRRTFFILKLYGTLERKDTVIVAPAQYESAITGNSLFSEFMQTLFFSRALLFVGASLDGIDSYLRGISFPRRVTRRHYAVVDVRDGAWRAKAEVLERRYGIRVLPYTAENDYQDLRDFLNKLTEAVASRQGADRGAQSRVSRLKRVVLEDIGPFKKLDLDLELGLAHNWHIFLGDNGVGKSTVLKAIALALCGKDAQPFAGRFLRDRPPNEQREPSSKTIGTITLETDNKTNYVTTIQRDDTTGQVDLISTTAQPLAAEGWLALGFPPLRTTGWEAPKGLDPNIRSADIERKSRPVVDDLLPLVTGDIDPRLDKLKAWILNLDYVDIKLGGTDGKYHKLVQSVFDIIGTVAEGMKLTYKGVDANKRILIETEEGTLIPLEALSQGTISLIGWIGILMQRLYQVFGTDEDPRQRYALILMDEIDAHMHPLWQRTLVSNLSHAFPNAQFIASTHSPLVVGGMPARQVVRFARDKSGAAVIVPIAPDMTLGYTDQVLTSLLFSIPPSLDRHTEIMKKRFDELDAVKELNEDEQAEHEQLKQELMVRVPAPSSTYEEKHQNQKEEAEDLLTLGTKLSERAPEEGRILIDRANNLFESIGEEPNP